jgi:anthranilate/para-aminobenzoate synthase component I
MHPTSLPPPPFALTRFHPHSAASSLEESEWYCLQGDRSILQIGGSCRLESYLSDLENLGPSFGFLSYELAEWSEEIPHRPRSMSGFPDAWAMRIAATRTVKLEGMLVESPGVPAGPVRCSLSTEDHRAALARIAEYLVAGDIYQANLTVEFSLSFDRDPLSLFLAIYEAAPVPYAAYLDAGDFQILSLSPELFLSCENRTLRTNPIKGTVPRGTTHEEDRALARWLTNSPKNLAELLMIVDLERNDLGRVCLPGSIQWGPFPSRLELTNVHHLCCPISGRLREGVGLSEVIKAAFPGGSISGAPKRRALQILRELEPHCRGPYCGALGFFDPNSMLLNLPIRTGIVHEKCLRFWGGGGIVIDHDPLVEQQEIRAKLAPFQRALGLDPERFWRD